MKFRRKGFHSDKTKAIQNGTAENGGPQNGT